MNHSSGRDAVEKLETLPVRLRRKIKYNLFSIGLEKENERVSGGVKG